MDNSLISTEPTPALAEIRARSLLAIAFVAIALPFIFFVRVWPKWLWRNETFLRDAVVESSCYLLLAFFLWRVCAEVGLRRWSSFGSKPSPRQLRTFIALGLPLVGISLAGLYTLFLPLSWIVPEFVSSWILYDIPIIRLGGSLEHLIGNTLNIVTLVFLAPVVEEVLFRGFLLNRWWKKYGLRKAIALTSFAFALLHVEVIGGVVFGLVTALIYVRTRSLAGPVLVHISNNAIVVFLLVVDAMLYGETSNTTVAEFNPIGGRHRWVRQ